MTMTVQFNVPAEVEEVFRSRGEKLADEMKEAYALELFRQGQLSSHGLSVALGLNRFETEAYLKRRGIFEGMPTHEDVESDIRRARELLGKSAP